MIFYSAFGDIYNTTESFTNVKNAASASTNSMKIIASVEAKAIKNADGIINSVGLINNNGRIIPRKAGINLDKNIYYTNDFILSDKQCQNANCNILFLKGRTTSDEVNNNTSSMIRNITDVIINRLYKLSPSLNMSAKNLIGYINSSYFIQAPYEIFHHFTDAHLKMLYDRNILSETHKRYILYNMEPSFAMKPNTHINNLQGPKEAINFDIQYSLDKVNDNSKNTVSAETASIIFSIEQARLRETYGKKFKIAGDYDRDTKTRVYTRDINNTDKAILTKNNTTIDDFNKMLKVVREKIYKIEPYNIMQSWVTQYFNKNNFANNNWKNEYFLYFTRSQIRDWIYNYRAAFTQNQLNYLKIVFNNSIFTDPGNIIDGNIVYTPLTEIDKQKLKNISDSYMITNTILSSLYQINPDDNIKSLENIPDDYFRDNKLSNNFNINNFHNFTRSQIEILKQKRNVFNSKQINYINEMLINSMKFP